MRELKFTHLFIAALFISAAILFLTSDIGIWRTWSFKDDPYDLAFYSLSTFLGVSIGIAYIGGIFLIIIGFLIGFFGFLSDILTHVLNILSRTPLILIITLVLLSSGALYYYLSMPKTRAECFASEFRKMTTSSEYAAAAVVAICLERFSIE